MQSTDMVNSIKKAVDHFEWRLKNFNGKTLKVSENDVKALNLISDFVEQKHKEQINDYQLFGKLFITFYGELLRFYKTDVFDKEPQKAINKILDSPMELIIQKFIDKAQEEEQRLQYVDKKTGNFKAQKDWKHVELVEKMDFEEAKTNLTAMINNAINSYN